MGLNSILRVHGKVSCGGICPPEFESSIRHGCLYFSVFVLEFNSHYSFSGRQHAHRVVDSETPIVTLSVLRIYRLCLSKAFIAVGLCACFYMSEYKCMFVSTSIYIVFRKKIKERERNQMQPPLHVP